LVSERILEVCLSLKRLYRKRILGLRSLERLVEKILENTVSVSTF